MSVWSRRKLYPTLPCQATLICGALCFKRKGTRGYREQFSSDLLEQVPVQIKYNCVKCLLQCLQVTVQQTFTFKFLLLCFRAVRWSCPLPAPHRGLGSLQGGVSCSHTNSSSDEGMLTQYCPLSPCSEFLPMFPVYHQFLSAMQSRPSGSQGELCSITSKIWLGVCFLLLGCGCTVALT